MKMAKQACTLEFKERAVRRVGEEQSLAGVAAQVRQKGAQVIVHAQFTDAELALHASGGERWPRLFGQQRLFDKWSPA
ncbi:hypothetical protein, partial [Accumulibacter sp.]|uniref:hypothetical protein n=1 Tax=Accumulibacter sp. TaxID=2053492 RepID=UPI0025E02E83